MTVINTARWFFGSPVMPLSEGSPIPREAKWFFGSPWMMEISELGGLQKFNPVEVVGVTDYASQWILEAIRRNLVELLGPEDANAYGYGLAKYVGDTVGIENVNEKLIGRGRTRAENIGVTDARVRKLWKLLMFVESLGATDDAPHGTTYRRPQAESISLDDTKITNLAIMRYMMDALGVTDYIKRVGYEIYYLSSMAQIGDELAIKKTMNRVLSDVVGPTDYVKAGKLLKRILTEYFSADYQLVSDDFNRTGGDLGPSPPWYKYVTAGDPNHAELQYSGGDGNLTWVYGDGVSPHLNICYRHSGMDGVANGYVKMRFVYWPIRSWFLFARCGSISNGTPQTGVYFSCDGGGMGSVGYFNSGTMVEIASFPLGSGDNKVKLACFGDKIRCYNGDHLVYEWTDEVTGRTSGYYGFGSPLPDEYWYGDDFEGGIVVDGIDDYAYSTEEPLTIKYFAEALGISDAQLVNGVMSIPLTWFGDNVNPDGSRINEPNTTALNFGGSTYMNDNNNLQFICPGTGPKSVEMLELYCYGSGNVRMAIYDSDGNLVCQWDAESSPGGASPIWWGKVKANLSGVTTITGGNEYRIAFTGDGSVYAARHYAEYGSVQWRNDNSDRTGGFPSTYSNPFYWSNQFRYYARIAVIDTEAGYIKPSNPIGITDGLRIIRQYIRALQEQFGVTDEMRQFQSPAHYVMTVADALYTLLIGIEQGTTYSEDISVADALNLKIILEQFISGDVGLEDVLSYMRAMTGQGFDSQQVSDSLVYQRTFGRPVADTITVTDGIRRNLQYLRAVSSLLGIPDNVLRGYLLYFKASDPIGIIDGGGMGGSEGGGEPPPGGGFGYISPAMEILQ